MTGTHILAIDQGTTSTRAIVFDRAFAPLASSQVELTQHYPQPGWVEHDAEEIWAATLKVCRDVIEKVGGGGAIAAIGVTNQRETTVIWDRKTGAPVHRAIVWQDRRTAEACAALRAAGHEAAVQRTTGLLLDPYFSASKIAWILDHAPGLRQRAEAGELAFGTIECFLVWRLTNGRAHVSDMTNAARTLLLDIKTLAWSDEMCALFHIPRALLPKPLPCDAHFGDADPSHFGFAIPVTGMAGDQQAALVGHGCMKPGMAKCTFGTGTFLVMNAGLEQPHSKNRLLATIGYQTQNDFAYAIEGSVFSAGSTVQWLRDGLGLIASSAQSEAIAASLGDNGGVYLVPAFAGLGAPQWRAEARGAILGLTRDSTSAHLVRAALEAVAYQTSDLLDALSGDGAPALEVLLVDGGMTANRWLMQFLADICDVEVARPEFQEVTALGAAKLAALGRGDASGMGSNVAQLETCKPQMAKSARTVLKQEWQRAVAAVLTAAR